MAYRQVFTRTLISKLGNMYLSMENLMMCDLTGVTNQTGSQTNGITNFENLNMAYECSCKA